MYWDHQAYWNIGLSYIKQSECQGAVELKSDQDNLILILFFIYFLKLWTGWLSSSEKIYRNEKAVLLAKWNPVVVGKLQHKDWACGSVVRLCGTVQTELHLQLCQNNERDFGLYSHCLGAGCLSSRRGSVVSFWLLRHWDCSCGCSGHGGRF